MTEKDRCYVIYRLEDRLGCVIEAIRIVEEKWSDGDDRKHSMLICYTDEREQLQRILKELRHE